jgi:hypothetical protein
MTVVVDAGLTGAMLMPSSCVGTAIQQQPSTGADPATVLTNLSPHLVMPTVTRAYDIFLLFSLVRSSFCSF